MKHDDVNYSAQDHQTWQQLYRAQVPLRNEQLISDFSAGLHALSILENKVPSLDEVNLKLQRLTGWKAVYKSGFVEPVEFFAMLSQKCFPVGSFIRDAKDLSYTPAPDVFHDLYGHIPFFTNPDYAQFNQEFGVRALKYADHPQIVEEFQRLYWFTIEFALVKTPSGPRIFGAGIASSFAECAYALSGKPDVRPFDLESIRNREFKIDEIQQRLYILDSPIQLYSCLDQFEKPYRNFKKGAHYANQ